MLRQLAATPEIFKPLAYEKISTKKGIRYEFRLPAGKYSVYGSLPWKWSVDGTRLDLNGKMQSKYIAHGSLQVFSTFQQQVKEMDMLSFKLMIQMPSMNHNYIYWIWIN